MKKEMYFLSDLEHHHERNRSITLTTGPVWRHPDTQFVVVSLLNESNKPQEVTVSILDWTTCDHPEYAKFASTAEESSDDESSSSDESSNSDAGLSNIDTSAIAALAAQADPNAMRPIIGPDLL
jgi:hypothetical protein